MKKILLILILLAMIAGIMIVKTSSDDSIILVEREQLKIDPTICEECSKFKTFYVYEDGKWTKKTLPLVWWMCVRLDDVKVYNPDAKSSYGYLVVSAIKAKKLKHGGVFIDPNRGVLFVYVRNETEGQEILNAIGGVKVVLLKGKYTMDQLEKWKKKLTGILLHSDIGGSAIGVDDTMNKVMIGLKKVDQKNLTKLEQILKELNIPLDAVYVREMVVKKAIKRY